MQARYRITMEAYCAGSRRRNNVAMAALTDIRRVLDMDKVPLVGEGGRLILHQDVHSTQQHGMVLGAR
jgi:hypothetical protein